MLNTALHDHFYLQNTAIIIFINCFHCHTLPFSFSFTWCRSCHIFTCGHANLWEVRLLVPLSVYCSFCWSICWSVRWSIIGALVCPWWLCQKAWCCDAAVMIVGVCEHGLGEGMNGVVCPCPPIRNDIVTLHHFYVKQQFFTHLCWMLRQSFALCLHQKHRFWYQNWKYCEVLKTLRHSASPHLLPFFFSLLFVSSFLPSSPAVVVAEAPVASVAAKDEAVFPFVQVGGVVL